MTSVVPVSTGEASVGASNRETVDGTDNEQGDDHRDSSHRADNHSRAGDDRTDREMTG